MAKERSVVLLYSPGLGSDVIYGRFLTENPHLFAAIVEFPTVPVKPQTGRPSERMVKKIYSASWAYLYLQLMVTGVYRVVSDRLGTSLRWRARQFGIPHRKEQSVSPGFLQWLAALKPHWIFNNSSNILKEDLLSVPTHGVLNYHCAPLPEFRGAANYFWLFIENRAEGHGTLHFVDTGLDTGDVVAFGCPVDIGPGTTIFSLWRDIRLSAYAVLDSVKSALEGRMPMPRTAQNHDAAVTRSFPSRKDVKALKSRGICTMSVPDLLYILRAACFGVPQQDPPDTRGSSSNGRT